MDIGKAFVMSCQTFEHFYQGTALLAGTDHIGEHIGKNDRLACHGIRKTFALNDILLELGADFVRNAFASDVGHTVQRGSQRHTGFEQV